ncbi:uncharacterized protein [Parasteatoda tepidariorum]|uniref:uncharacterized protein n=1 Tax=Parasteatoda tepidariorum TaxID=114398 RepID=UPI0039BC4D8D
MKYSRLMQLRHNNIVDRVKNAALYKDRFNILYENQVVPNCGGKRPDLVLARGDKAYIIDVTIPFENQKDSFRAARQRKIDAYKNVEQELRKTYKSVETNAIIVGSLGSWDTLNNPVLQLFASRRYIKKMAKLCVSDTIRTSRNIYVEHLTGKPQQIIFIGQYTLIFCYRIVTG